MKKIRIGIISPSEIALRRFMPALSKMSDHFVFAGIAIASEEEWSGPMCSEVKESEFAKANKFVEQYGGKVFQSYTELMENTDIDAVYIPLPPALHYQWALVALNNHKHVFVEKPSTTALADTLSLITKAKQLQLALHENYMFIYHQQITEIQKLLSSQAIGDVRLIRANFGFPKRAINDFRYNKALGGGALLDCGGYPIKLVNLLMNGQAQVDAAKLIFNEQEIDLYGSVQLSTSTQVAQVSFGMDNEYRCDLSIWGSQGMLSTHRIFSAPDDFVCTIDIEKNREKETIEVKPDDTFRKSLEHFYQCIHDSDIREQTYEQLRKQITLVEDVMKRNQGLSYE